MLTEASCTKREERGAGICLQRPAAPNVRKEVLAALRMYNNTNK